MNINIESYPDLRAVGGEQNDKKRVLDALSVYDGINGREYGLFDTIPPYRAEEMMEKLQSHNWWIGLVARETGHDEEPVVASAAVLLEPGKDRMWIDGVSVARDYQGTGIGSEIIYDIIQTAKRNKLGYVALKSVPHAVEFYQRRGFEVVEPARQPIMEFKIT